MKKHFDFSENKMTNDELCKKCGGKCCESCGCAFFPDDFEFELNFENLKFEIDKGFIAIDAIFYGESIYEKLDVPIYYLRVRNINDSTPIGINGYGTCKRLKENHCEFSLEKRPSGGRYLIPFWSGCYTLYTVQKFSDFWRPYQEILMLLIEHYEKQ